MIVQPLAVDFLVVPDVCLVAVNKCGEMPNGSAAWEEFGRRISETRDNFYSEETQWSHIA